MPRLRDPEVRKRLPFAEVRVSSLYNDLDAVEHSIAKGNFEAASEELGKIVVDRNALLFESIERNDLEDIPFVQLPGREEFDAMTIEAQTRRVAEAMFDTVAKLRASVERFLDIDFDESVWLKCIEAQKILGWYVAHSGLPDEEPAMVWTDWKREVNPSRWEPEDAFRSCYLTFPDVPFPKYNGTSKPVYDVPTFKNGTAHWLEEQLPKLEAKREQLGRPLSLTAVAMHSGLSRDTLRLMRDWLPPRNEVGMRLRRLMTDDERRCWVWYADDSPASKAPMFDDVFKRRMGMGTTGKRSTTDG